MDSQLLLNCACEKKVKVVKYTHGRSRPPAPRSGHQEKDDEQVSAFLVKSESIELVAKKLSRLMRETGELFQESNHE
jgi:hypothetical protein